ncbi:MAG TPA: response regulator transcription factor [Candidatus Dormibacteraeota bacterium]|nr:response regulator transcription factor [Candidatus Dormibacteraeota bacterium]
MRILLAEDDAPVRSVLVRGLEESGYIVDGVDRGDDALHMLRLYEYAAAILDWRMPGLPGDEVVRQARGLKIFTPILMLTARDGLSDKVHGLDSGADDYLVKPVSFEELLARLRALLRRPPQVEAPVLQLGQVTLDPATRVVSVDGAAIDLRAREFAMLELLMRRTPAVVSREAIGLHAWPDESEAAGSNTIDVHAARLRRKLAGSGVDLVAVRGAGYRLVEHG